MWQFSAIQTSYYEVIVRINRLPIIYVKAYNINTPIVRAYNGFV